MFKPTLKPNLKSEKFEIRCVFYFMFWVVHELLMIARLYCHILKIEGYNSVSSAKKMKKLRLQPPLKVTRLKALFIYL